ncbi:thiamine pyrophosphate-dependent enzyme [Janibacter sp. GS2]|uniref:thiamine pyrophosphate-dependent enzyme n=1 Tax=Janibacter sp. GS2 TaxID=3442646 RepID=UPI003EBACF48
MTTRSAGTLLVEQLAHEGVERVYCVPGESYLDALDALGDSPIRTVVCRQEGGAGFMAVADGRLKKGVGVAMVTRGPGAANAMISVHTAWQDATPMVLFVGLVPVADRGREAFQEFDLTAWFGSTAKRVITLEAPDRAAEVVAEACHVARSGRPGPVVVGLPEDVLVGRTARGVVPPRPVATGGPSAGQVGEVVDLLGSARRPLVIVGGDRWTAEDATALTQWAQAWHVPVAADFRAHDIIDHRSEAYVGSFGFGRSPALAQVLDEADLLVFIGCSAADVLSDGYQRGGRADRVVVVDPDPGLLQHHLRVDVHAVCAPAPFVAELATQGAPPGAVPWRAWAADARAAHESFSTPAPDGVSTGVDLGAAMAVLRDVLDEDAVITYGAGNHAIWAQRYLPHHTYPSMLAPRNGAMGFGVPAAVAASIALPGRQVVSIAGDGCFLMNGQEMATAAAHGVAPVVLVVDNGMYGTIRTHQEREYPGRPSGTALTNPDFAEYGRAFGGFGERVERTEDLPGALERAIASGRPSILHLVADPSVLLPVPEGA